MLKAVTATARKIAVPFYNTLRHGVDRGNPRGARGEHAVGPASRGRLARTCAAVRKHPEYTEQDIL